jgi:hypothetical protein
VLSLLLYPRLSSSNVPFTGFSLFVGVSTSDGSRRHRQKGKAFPCPRDHWAATKQGG